PESVSNWSKDAKNNIFTRWWHNVQAPHWDTDSWPINYLGHPYFGSTYYARARERGFGEFDSFIYPALASAMYEFGTEALFERPSYQDLFVTPIGGALVGLALEPIRNWIKLKPDPRWYDQLFLAATDPIGMLNGVFERMMGIKSDLRVDLGQGNRIYVQLQMNGNETPRGGSNEKEKARGLDRGLQAPHPVAALRPVEEEGRSGGEGAGARREAARAGQGRGIGDEGPRDGRGHRQGRGHRDAQGTQTQHHDRGQRQVEARPDQGGRSRGGGVHRGGCLARHGSRPRSRTRPI